MPFSTISALWESPFPDDTGNTECVCHLSMICTYFWHGLPWISLSLQAVFSAFDVLLFLTAGLLRRKIQGFFRYCPTNMDVGNSQGWNCYLFCLGLAEAPTAVHCHVLHCSDHPPDLVSQHILCCVSQFCLDRWRMLRLWGCPSVCQPQIRK